MNIRIDQRRCGAGKTTTTLYQHIDRCIALNQPTLIVVLRYSSSELNAIMRR